MTIDTKMYYRTTVTCDTCGKVTRSEGETITPHNYVPADWIHGAPPGISDMHEFCSMACFQSYEYKGPNKPWVEDPAPAPTADPAPAEATS